MAIGPKLTPLQEVEARRAAAAADKPKRAISEEEKATRKDRVAKAKDALARSVGAKGDWVIAGRAALKTYLQRLNEPKQPDDAQFEALIAAPFTPPPPLTTSQPPIGKMVSLPDVPLITSANPLENFPVMMAMDVDPTQYTSAYPSSRTSVYLLGK